MRACAHALHQRRPAADPVITADTELPLSLVTFDTLAAINEMAPFGSDNSYPLFMARDVHVVDAFTVGETAHLKMMLADRSNLSGAPIEAIAFRMATCSTPSSGTGAWISSSILSGASGRAKFTCNCACVICASQAATNTPPMLPEPATLPRLRRAVQG